MLIFVLLMLTETPTAGVQVSGDSQIRSPFSGSEIVVTTTSRVAGAIHSITWDGQEFIDSADHGRQLQSAANFDAGTAFVSETFNPTEAGSRRDGAGSTSTSRLQWLRARDNVLETRSRMAFWLQPGETSSGHPAKNLTALSDHQLQKRVVIGVEDLGNVLDYQVTFTIPPQEKHRYAQFETVTGYMPPAFSRFLIYDPATSAPEPVSDGPGEQPFPVIFSTESGTHAMGVYSPRQPSPGFESAGYGRFRFPDQQVVKWNCVFRERASSGIVAPGDYSFRCFVILGSLEDVVRSLRALHQRYPHQPAAP